jgi:hypothetical protein
MFPGERKAQFFALLEIQKKLRTRWETTNLFLKANFGLVNATTTTDRTYRMLHATASIPCHSTLFLLAKTLYPEQASELEDSDLFPQGGKQTGLHLAAASVASGEAAKAVVVALLELNPAAVQVADSAQGSLPLHIFVERKHHWVHDGIRDVYQAYPAALQQGDAIGRLPLHRAAQANQHGGGPGGSIILELMEASIRTVGTSLCCGMRRNLGRRIGSDLSRTRSGCPRTSRTIRAITTAHGSCLS